MRKKVKRKSHSIDRPPLRDDTNGQGHEESPPPPTICERHHNGEEQSLFHFLALSSFVLMFPLVYYCNSYYRNIEMDQMAYEKLNYETTEAQTLASKAMAGIRRGTLKFKVDKILPETITVRCSELRTRIEKISRDIENAENAKADKELHQLKVDMTGENQ